MLGPGDPAPDFFLPRADDPDAEYMLSAAADAGPVVLAFVPAAETPALSLLRPIANVDWASVTDRVAVLAIGESPDVTRRLAERGLPFPILLDRDGYVSARYELSAREGGGIPRALVVADRRCTIRFAWEATDPSEGAPVDDLTSTIASL